MSSFSFSVSVLRFISVRIWHFSEFYYLSVSSEIIYMYGSTIYPLNWDWISPQRPPWGQRRVTDVGRWPFGEINNCIAKMEVGCLEYPGASTIGSQPLDWNNAPMTGTTAQPSHEPPHERKGTGHPSHWKTSVKKTTTATTKPGERLKEPHGAFKLYDET